MSNICSLFYNLTARKPIVFRPWVFWRYIAIACISCDFQQTKGIRSEQVINTGKIYGFRKFDKVRYLGNEYRIGDKIDIVGTLEINSFNGFSSIQINVKDIRKSY